MTEITDIFEEIEEMLEEDWNDLVRRGLHNDVVTKYISNFINKSKNYFPKRI